MPYVFEVNWKAGKLNMIADAFSRAPVSLPELSDTDECFMCYIGGCDLALKDGIYNAANSDEYRKVIACILERKDLNNLPPQHPAQQYASFWHSLSVSEKKDLIIYNGSKILVPHQARPGVLKFIHKGHCGFMKTKNLL